MKQKIYLVYSTFAAVLLTLLYNGNVMTNNSAAPPGRTNNGINNGSCASSGCHTGTLQNGQAIFDIKIGTSLGNQVNATPSFSYIPGTEYFMSIITLGTSARYGFSLSSVTTSNTNGGTFTATNAQNTFATTFNNVSYIGHLNGGTNKNWTFKWTAPSSSQGDITFHGILNLADGNGNSAGDNIYKKTASISPDNATNIIELRDNLNKLSVYPNPVNEQFAIAYDLNLAADVKADLYDITGRLVQPLIHEIQAPGTYSQRFYLNEKVSSGVYLMKLTAGNQSTTRRILIQ